MPTTAQPVIANLNTAIYPIRVVLARRVLVVDDDSMLCLLLGEMIQQMGHGVCGSASSAAAALALAAFHTPDLLIVAARLGDHSGLDMVTQITARAAIPHVFITGNIQGLRKLRPNALALEKPFREAALAMVIQLALGGWPIEQL